MGRTPAFAITQMGDDQLGRSRNLEWDRLDQIANT
jgi:hypothetical protein